MKTLIITTAFIFFLFNSASAQSQTPTILKSRICNGFATYLPKPEQPKPSSENVSGAVNVQVLIDEQGDVTSARAASGHPLLRPLAEQAALKAKFRQTILSGKPIKVSCLLFYKFIPDEPTQTEDNKVITKGIINGSAILLPKPEYTKEAKDFCASGQVQVEVLVGEDGNVISAEAVSGDELLRDSAITAVRKAKFATSGHFPFVKVRGIIVYNFVPEIKCIEAGVVNKKAVYLPKPVYPKSCRCAGNVVIRIVIDLNGNVISARAFSGHPLLRVSALESARKAKFPPSLVNGGNQFYVKALLVYNFNSDSLVEPNQEEQKQPEISKGKTIVDLAGGTVIGRAIKLVKPPTPSCNCRFGTVKSITSVSVEANIDEKGNVSKATAISGHPILKTGSQLAAQKSKFLPSLVSGSQVKAKALIVYKFIIVNKWSVKFMSVEVKDIQIENQAAN